MKQVKFYKLVILLLVGLNAVTLYFLWTSTDDKRGGRPHRKSLVTVLDLKGNAKTTIAQLEKEHFHEKDSLINSSRKLHEQLFQYFGDATKDSTSIATLIDKIVENQRYTEQMTFDYFKSVSRLCTKKQRVELNHAIHFAIKGMGSGPHPRPKN